jgi:parallel beta-helix repeat protein
VNGNVLNDNLADGLELRRDSSSNTIHDNRTVRNLGVGIKVTESNDNDFRNDTIRGNGRGVVVKLGSSGNLFYQCDISRNIGNAVELFKGSEEPITTDGRPRFNNFFDNTILANGGLGLRIADADSTTFNENSFGVNGGGGKLEVRRGNSNVFLSNTIPASVTLETTGNPALSATTVVSGQIQTRVQVNANAATQFTSAFQASYVWDSGIPGVATEIAPSGSSMLLDSSVLGGNSTVVTQLPFQAFVPSFIVNISPVRWDRTGQRIKKWLVQALIGTQSVSYIIGDLVPGNSYNVLRGSMLVASETADQNGTVQFADAPQSTDPVEYTVTPSDALTSTPSFRPNFGMEPP